MTDRPIAVRVLMMSNDISTIETLSRFMQHLAGHVEIACDSPSAMRKLCRSKFEGIILDLAEKSQGLELLDRLHTMSSHRGLVVFTVVNSDADAQAAFRAGANFVLQRPLSSGIVARTLRAAYPIMVRERRRYFRCPLDTGIVVAHGAEGEFTARTINISEGGMAINSPRPVHVGEKLRLRFSLEPTLDPISVVAEVCWSDATNRTGVKFNQVSAQFQEQLQNWLADRLGAEMASGQETGEMAVATVE